MDGIASVSAFDFLPNGRGSSFYIRVTALHCILISFALLCELFVFSKPKEPCLQERFVCATSSYFKAG